MNGAPLADLVFAGSSPKYIREIDQAYHVALIAENSQQLVHYHRDLLRLQVGSAAVNLHAYQEMSRQHREANRYLSDIEHDCGAIAEGIDRLGNAISAGFEDINDVLSDGFARLSQHMIQQQRVLQDIAETLRLPYKAKVSELRREATKWLRSGMKALGRDREESWQDADRLLRTVIANPIGMQDYVIWFYIGWLLWKHKKKIPEAEEAFSRAQRLSTETRDLYHVTSLRHLAHMQYLQAKHGAAYGTVQKAMELCQDHATLYQAALYGAKAGHGQEWLGLLDRCIDLEPTTFFTMFSEADFPAPALTDFASVKLAKAKRQAKQRCEDFRRAVETIKRAARKAEHEIGLESSLVETLASAELQKADYLATVTISGKASVARDTILRGARRSLESELKARSREVVQAKARVDAPGPIPAWPEDGVVFPLGCLVSVTSFVIWASLQVLAQLTGGTSVLYRALLSIALLGLLGVVIVPSAVYFIWWLRRLAATAKNQANTPALEERAARAKEQLRRATEAFDMIADLGPITEDDTRPTKPLHKTDAYPHESEDADDDEDWHAFEKWARTVDEKDSPLGPEKARDSSSGRNRRKKRRKSEDKSDEEYFGI